MKPDLLPALAAAQGIDASAARLAPYAGMVASTDDLLRKAAAERLRFDSEPSHFLRTFEREAPRS